MKNTTINIPSIKAVFAESASLQNDIKELVKSKTLSKEELNTLQENVNSLIETLEELKASRF